MFFFLESSGKETRGVDYSRNTSFFLSDIFGESSYVVSRFREGSRNKGKTLVVTLLLYTHNIVITLHFLPKPSSPRAIFYPNFNRLEDVFYDSFSRDKRHFFDTEHEWYFDKSTREKIVDFLLKRKRFSDNDEDDLAFGIAKLMKLGVYCDAYPVHDGDLGDESENLDNYCL